ncbi:thioredoxin-disulfide reductase [Spelaeicoccus albus]|uniref:Thioredoxin reductase n=1 Tax=Spelaeicoccus albus TaxID=1280376 RepID=A0A7Z0CZT8_9MICO|nr:thioredoxin-disulfide reductase [Spelaeicoccus albus]NYI66579.1 thioredoxin reductase (NADPH) [Spelaeicoccus albus]
MSEPASSAEVIRDVVIVGSGPAGYTAGVYTARANLNPLVIAGSVTAGGELMNTTEVENYPGFPTGVMGPDLMEDMRAQAEKFGAEIVYDDVTSMELTDDVKTLTTGNGQLVRARTVILATGSAYRKLGIPREDALSGFGISWCATCDGFFFKDQDIVVVGGGDSAMEEATFLTKFAATVTIVHRRDELRASQIMADRARSNDKIKFLFDSEVSEILGENKVEGLVINNTRTGEHQQIDATGLFIAVGSDPRVDLFADQLTIRPDGYLAVEGRSSRTGVPGVFAAGDVIDPVYRQAVTAAGSGCSAALDAEHYLASI